MSLTPILHPWEANLIAIDFPIPCFAPVINAFLTFNNNFPLIKFDLYFVISISFIEFTTPFIDWIDNFSPLSEDDFCIPISFEDCTLSILTICGNAYIAKEVSNSPPWPGYSFVSRIKNKIVFADLKLNDIPKKEMADKIGKEIAKRSLEKGIKLVAFDKGKYKYHGLIKILAEAAREAGLNF